MDVFAFRDQLLTDYQSYIRSFITIRDVQIAGLVEEQMREGYLWPDPLIQMNPAFQSAASIDELVTSQVLHAECARIFRIKRDQADELGQPMRLYQHQEDAIRCARDGLPYLLTTGTGSGKSLAYIIPIVDAVLRRGAGQGIQAIVVYPMNALANSQEHELQKFLHYGYPAGQPPVRFARYTGQDDEATRSAIIEHPPDILLTNYVMLELILTRSREQPLIQAAQALRFLVLDELHTYRGRQGSDVAMLLRRARDQFNCPKVQLVGTSATLASLGALADQHRESAAVASQLFGRLVSPDHVIGETLQRLTPEFDETDPAARMSLAAAVTTSAAQPVNDAVHAPSPLAQWLESTFGITRETTTGRLKRAQPISVRVASQQLSALTGVPAPACATVIQRNLLAGYQRTPTTPGTPAPFAFRLHQFISRGDTIYATLHPAADRYLTLQAQQFRPGHRDQVLMPLVFCRECGQEYLCVVRREATSDQPTHYLPRDYGDFEATDHVMPGFLYFHDTDEWPGEDRDILEYLPEDWVEPDARTGEAKLVASHRKDLPLAVRVKTDGQEDAAGNSCYFIGAPFRFCLRCGVSYDSFQKSDFSKLATLSSEGRSTATTVLSLASIRRLRAQGDLPDTARKLLSFTDNRQDAALQAGHFNDFIELGRLRGALYRAVATALEGLTHDTLTQRVMTAMALEISEYAADPGVRYQARHETDRALRDVLGYRLYRDLRRGWRINSPNLEQTGLLRVHYVSLDELCADEPVWAMTHPSLATATPAIRRHIASALLDTVRRELAIKVEYLDNLYLDQVQLRSTQHLVAPWALDENEPRELATIVYPRARQPGDTRQMVMLSARGGFGKLLRRSTAFGPGRQRMTVRDAERVIRDLFECLRVAGLVAIAAPPQRQEEVPGYQIPAAAMQWLVGDGRQAHRDPLRMPTLSDSPSPPNKFFVQYYQNMASELAGMTAREHTAQVPTREREDREQAFRAGTLPILYCSPTMELGVDIAELNVVNLRNVPPTPANYAQRSGRAGRNGQPALVFTYCTTGSPHDQFFFHHQVEMVAGVVSPPRIDLTNEDLIRSHMHAIWLTETELYLGRSLRDLLDVSGEAPTLRLLEQTQAAIVRPGVAARARRRCAAVLDSIQDELATADWYTTTWLDSVLAGVAQGFDATCDRWRDLYRAAHKQQQVQNAIIRDASRPAAEKTIARRLRSEAESQLQLLTEIDSTSQSDFYSYRYFAAEGFLPGYAFPRLPLSAYIPARHGKLRDEYLSRPRFLAIAEFGPRAFIYHEGSRYLINRVILPIGDPAAETPREKVALGQAARCGACGYLHPIDADHQADLCEQCGARLGAPLVKLFRMQNVSTRRRDRINSDEEERQRMGFDIQTGVRFATHGGAPLVRQGAIVGDDGPVLATREIATLRFGAAATLWRLNLGWRRRRDQQHYGFALDLARGYWKRDGAAGDDGDLDDPLDAAAVERIIPYVEDRRNCLLFEPTHRLGSGGMRSLMAALKSAIQVAYQLEDNELAAELLPDADTARHILLFESAEGGAGALRRLLDDQHGMARVARTALELCHFDPETGADLRRAPHAREDCEAACYDCLMSYYNQRDHRFLDRQAIAPFLRDLQAGRVLRSSGSAPRGEHLAMLKRMAGSTLETEWLDYLEARGLRLPDRAQVLIPIAQTRPDFVYDAAAQTAIYIDGPPHDYPERQARDLAQQTALEDAGWCVVRFSHRDDWDAIVARYGYIFGTEEPE